MIHTKKVFIGLSGGVDSSVSALLLKQQGYDVTGVFIKVWQPDFVECTWKEDRLDAIRVASQLGIPFVTLDLVKEYKEGVIDYMLNEYKAANTSQASRILTQLQNPFSRKMQVLMGGRDSETVGVKSGMQGTVQDTPTQSTQ